MSTYYWANHEDGGSFEADNDQDALDIAPADATFISRMTEGDEIIILDNR